MQLPNYHDGSIVNLMSSIKGAFGKSTKYNELKLLPSKDLKKSKNIVLLVLDGLGYEYLRRNVKGTAFEKGLKGKMTSVFLSSTAPATLTFLTGVAPQQHAITGWFMYLRELGIVSTILPFKPRAGGSSFSDIGLNFKDLLPVEGFSRKLGVSSFIVFPKELTKKDATLAVAGDSKIIGYNNLKGFFKQTEKVVKSHNRRKFIYSYWPEFDDVAHDNGIGSTKTKKHFAQLGKGLQKFLKKLDGTNTTVIVTADHGLIDTNKKRCIYFEDHPELLDCLTLPLCGDTRTVYCYVRPFKAKQFENYVKTKLKNKVDLYKSEDLVKKNFFGLFAPSKKLFSRIGDYVLIPKENYAIRDTLSNQKKSFTKGNHGGLSKEEMLVPLIVYDL